jgi:hypothetical protein
MLLFLPLFILYCLLGSTLLFNSWAYLPENAVVISMEVCSPPAWIDWFNHLLFHCECLCTYFTLWIIIQDVIVYSCHHYFTLVLHIGTSFSWLLCPFNIPPTLGFIFHSVFTFWHWKFFQACMGCFPSYFYNQSFFSSILSPLYWKIVWETKTWVVNVAKVIEVLLVLGLLDD